jgi:hypothetical protein
MGSRMEQGGAGVEGDVLRDASPAAASRPTASNNGSKGEDATRGGGLGGARPVSRMIGSRGLGPCLLPHLKKFHSWTYMI